MSDTPRTDEIQALYDEEALAALNDGYKVHRSQPVITVAAFGPITCSSPPMTRT